MVDRADRAAWNGTDRVGAFDRVGVDATGWSDLEIDFHNQVLAAMAAENAAELEPEITEPGEGGPLILEASLSGAGMSARFPLSHSMLRAVRKHRATGQLSMPGIYRVMEPAYAYAAEDHGFI